ncbi:hypothetical protein [Clostridium sp.]|uniref:hypothetical protein n=1 Tax=Clostridium sp. TaxID=1506 RepID=UPI002604E186|nr:hypothetical protein [Clostridium sp.]
MENNNLEKEENKEILEKKEIVIDEKIDEEKKGLLEGFEDEKVEVKPGFLKKLLSGIIDQILSIAGSLLLLVLFDAIIRLIGYQVADREPMFLIMYIITNVVYRPILESTKLKETIGKKLIK